MSPVLKPHRKRILVVATLLALFAFMVIGGAYVGTTAFGESIFAVPTPNFQWWTRLPPAKQTVVARSFPTVNPSARIAPAVIPTPVFPTSPPQPEFPTNVPRRSAGAGVIIEIAGEAPLDHTYSVVNEWYATTTNEKIRVFAGGIWNNPLFTERSQGFVYVMYKSLDFSQSTRPPVLATTATQTGALTIVDATGMKLKLQSEKGITYFFDVNAGKFVSQ